VVNQAEPPKLTLMVEGPLRLAARYWLTLRNLPLCLTFILGALSFLKGETQPPGIEIFVDATQVSHKVLHAELTIKANAGPLTLFYPKWMPADHSPDGPIWNLAGLRFFAGGKSLPWEQDSLDMYTFHLQVPAQVNSVKAQLDFLLSAPGPTIDFSASGSSNLFVLMWNQVMLYPAGWPANQIMVRPSLRLPDGWKFATSLPVWERESDTITFKPLALDLLVDSPVQSGEHMKVIPLTPGETPVHEIDIAADAAAGLEIPTDAIDKYKRLLREALALYKSHHYREYHFLLTLSDHVMELGQEHHESSDDRMPANGLSDPNRRLVAGDLFSHEFTHSWNGQYRRPAGLATPDFQQPMKGDMLWVYEGLTTYLGMVLAARSGLWTAEQAGEHLAVLTSTLDRRAGRTWRSLENTSRAGQVLYFSPSPWRSYRRGTDFYPESVLIWLEADVTIRKLTQGKRSLDDFCLAFLGGPEVTPSIKSYTFDDLVTAMNEITSFDWRTFFRDRLDSTSIRAPLGGLTEGGWELNYEEMPNSMMMAEQATSGVADYSSSIGLLVKIDGTVEDSIPGMVAWQSGVSPYTRIIGIDGHEFSIDKLNTAITASKLTKRPISLLVTNAGQLEDHQLVYGEGLRYPHLKRNDEIDYLERILQPRATH
jgi:predicted metalloprotease with PDZ domain